MEFKIDFRKDRAHSCLNAKDTIKGNEFFIDFNCVEFLSGGNAVKRQFLLLKILISFS